MATFVIQGRFSADAISVAPVTGSTVTYTIVPRIVAIAVGV